MAANDQDTTSTIESVLKFIGKSPWDDQLRRTYRYSLRARKSWRSRKAMKKAVENDHKEPSR